MKLINKDKVVAKIERLQDATVDENANFYSAKAQAEFFVLCELECFLDTLEVKEVDLEKEVREYVIKNGTSLEEPDEFLTTLMLLDDMVMFAKHFFELGLKAQKGE